MIRILGILALLSILALPCSCPGLSGGRICGKLYRRRWQVLHRPHIHDEGRRRHIIMQPAAFRHLNPSRLWARLSARPQWEDTAHPTLPVAKTFSSAPAAKPLPAYLAKPLPAIRCLPFRLAYQESGSCSSLRARPSPWTCINPETGSLAGGASPLAAPPSWPWPAEPHPATA